MTDNGKQYTEEQAALAQRDEKDAMVDATLTYLQNRTVVLNIEVRQRDAEIERLKAEAQELREEILRLRGSGPETTSARRRETPETVLGEVERSEADTDT
jgi:hypothetical protein